MKDQRRNYTTLDIMRECNRSLSAQGMVEVTSPNTIREDIMAIQYQWRVEVEMVVSGRNRYYLYADPHFSIFKGLKKLFRMGFPEMMAKNGSWR